MDYRAALIRCSQLSEYVVYGVFCHKLAEGDAGHYLEPRPLTLEEWHFNVRSEEGLNAFMQGLQPHHIAVIMQSTSEWTMEDRRRVVAKVEALA